MSVQMDSPNRLTEAYNIQDFPEIGTPRQGSTGYEFEDELPNEIEVGDIIERKFNSSREPSRRFILEIEDHGLITWILNEGRYSYYPINFLLEDYSEDEMNIVDDPWNLR